MRFENAEELLRVKESPLFSSITSSSSCLITVVESGDDNVLQLLGLVNELNVASSHDPEVERQDEGAGRRVQARQGLALY